ncbi:MAG: bifunctional [glutamate--ammonia ligase]-adenylyl-L-tyrosine phosphorylase/[glutamate--ammonia-ligase] adenylyltransferase [Methylibium sp.]|uniref:bifunctional [glutamate--ammonia ligase]-adenylyl-L-tyrosine phosphorylase/[glutamate--ammonia-ligase] adenylyltransferase n=1 Tax=Methylibium sp. TaxID=2067992 RepID=UPI0017F00530|nr:bifunctional [glutamate--ammonia ligase]-adenylyl-L-tyrosine phosphorylase/[glutamate--ammonia-ligase] adenylyltransferase [Methylibium sp.]MBA2721515.1 bifunctional [glutamate--ammonia ligase]-adenylyl-L-tyrosine phosphorylase/[glutamate--ammonia-ligase] adenylyltransferase [Methylibium sp.]MBA3596669.1 bifunctional [glutamate--ammonia ligase]-adenylyl-L-tyrosine phosphorylase/[glutamate--ammonia-ligase] adenylyltransferase [Methylibium sp.]
MTVSSSEASAANAGRATSIALGNARADHSRFVQRIRRRYAGELALLPPGLPSRDSIHALIDTLVNGGRALPAALRVARQLVLERLAVLDVEAQLPLDAVTRTMSLLAEVTLDRALAQAFDEQDAKHGAPLRADGMRSCFWVLGMGKLGARELNVSSDIDLIYVYEEDGPTAGRAEGRGIVTGHEYFSQVARTLYALIGETTEDGNVFRVDLALRPNGNSGPAVVSLAMLEEYFLVQGREWERFAWLKSRVVAPASAMSNGEALGLRDVVVPFVFRRYLDYGVFEGLRQLHRKIRDEAAKRAAGRPERANDVKLSRGGIREIEFTVQLLQVVRGGQYPELRTRSTLAALDRLVAVGVMKPDTALRLGEAYRFLRRLEHRIQYLDDQQTHVLPTDDADLGWIARSMGLACREDACELLDTLCGHREFVATEFDALLHDGRAPTANGDCKRCGGPPPALDSEAFLSRLPAPIAERVKTFCATPKVALLRDETKQRLARLIARAAVSVAATAPHSEASPARDAAHYQPMLRFIDWIEPLLRRESYLALLAERPEVLARLLRLLGLARWPMRYLMRYPGVIDELADARALSVRFEREAYLRDLHERHGAWTRGGQADEESLLDTLRRAHHAEVFRTLVRDVEGQLTVEQVADDLSALADATLDCAIRWAWQHLRQRHRDDPRYAVVAYGKLGGKELGYGSDLDVVFLFDDADEPDADRAAEVYAAFTRKLVNWLTLRTPAGELFDIDTALRPNGNSGLLVTSIAAFERYQTQRGSNTAWTWEHQAITRARWCAGEPSLAPRVEAVRRAVLAAPRDPQALREEVQTMRERVRAAHPLPRADGPPRFDVKHGEGGMMDVEFAVQTLVLAHSAEHPPLREDVGNIALLQLAEARGLLPAGVGHAAADAYRELRRAQHRARLDEAPTQFDAGSHKVERDAVRALVRAVFGPP